MRKITSVILTVCFIVLLITVAFMAGPKHQEGMRRGGPPVASANAEMRHSAKPPHGAFFPKELHELAGYTFLVFGIVHIVINGKCLLSYVRVRNQDNR